MKFIQFSIIALVIACTAACKKDFLQRDIGVQTTLDDIFQNPLQASRYADNTYTFSLNDYGRLNGYKGMTSEFTDESISNTSQAEITPFNTGNLLDPGATDVTNIYTNMYRGIRNANVVLANMAKTPWTAEYNANYIKGEQLYLRAYFYFELVKRYGGVILFSEPQDFVDAAKDPTRNSFDETLSFILSDLEQAIALLPLTNNDWPNPAAQANRATAAAAMALKTRALMLGASPLWNPGGDAAPWQKAADAAKAIMNLNRFSLEPNYNNVLQVSTSPEYIRIWSRGPRGFSGTYVQDFLAPTSFGGGQSNMSPTQNHVNLYEMANGKPISDPASGYNPQKPYLNRDPRFYTNLLYNGATWQGRAVQTWQSEPNATGVVTYGTDINATLTFTKTSYYLKRLWPEALKSGSTANALLNFVFYRYAEVLLNYAESQNEATGPNSEVYAAVDAVRMRAGMPKLPSGLTKEDMRARIHNERAVEFAFEDMRWWDILRWKNGKELVAQPIKGMKVIKKTDGTFSFTEVEMPAYQKVFADRMYLYPIPQSEMNKTSGALKQNPGW